MRPMGKELHTDAPKRVTTPRVAVDETDGLGFSPGALARKVPTTAPPGGLRHPQASPSSASKRGAFARKNLYTHMSTIGSPAVSKPGLQSMIWRMT
jgi:hypothetical protein